MIEKKFDNQGNLIWAKGKARDVFRNTEVANSKGIVFRVSDESPTYHLLIPRHCAGSIIGERIQSDGKLPPFPEWRFVLVGYGKAAERLVEISREIPGDVIVEVERLAGAEEIKRRD